MKFTENELKILDTLVERGSTEYHDVKAVTDNCSLNKKTAGLVIAGMKQRGILIVENTFSGDSCKITPSIAIPVSHALTILKRLEGKLGMNIETPKK